MVVRAARRWATRAISLGLHAGAIVLAVEVIPHRPPPKPQPIVELIPIAIAMPPEPVTPPPSGAGALIPDKPAGDAGTRGRRGHDAPKRAQARIQPVADAFQGLSVHYDAPAGPHPGTAEGQVEGGLGLGVAGAGAGEIGVGGLNVPPAPSSGRSLARRPKSKFPYDHMAFIAPPQFIGSHILLELTIDPHGNVRKVRVIRSVDPNVDQRAATAASNFEFHPALDDDGQAIWSQLRWTFEITSQS